MSRNQKLQQARELAGKLFDQKIMDLETMGAEDIKRWMNEFPLLSLREFEDVLQQTIKAKLAQQSQVGWQVIPRDIAVIVFSVVSILSNLTAGIIAGVAVLILLGIFFNVYYSEKVNKLLSYTVWLTYPALILLGYHLIRGGLVWWAGIAVVVLAWLISFVLDFIARMIFFQYLKIKAQLKKPQEKKAE